jgi:hypothetical protein
VKHVPDLQERRYRLLQLASKLANLPPSTLIKAHDPVTEWMGWDHGAESFNGKVDAAKGSFYANPVYDVPESDPKLLDTFPELTHPNLWLPEDLPELEPAFKQLAKLIVSVGTLVAYQCDKFAKSRNIKEYPSSDYLFNVVNTSRTHKGRLLHYFPLNTLPEEERKKSNLDNLCGWHFDNSCITGMYHTTLLLVNLLLILRLGIWA